MRPFLAHFTFRPGPIRDEGGGVLQGFVEACLTFRHGVVRSDFDLAETLKVKALSKPKMLPFYPLGRGTPVSSLVRHSLTNSRGVLLAPSPGKPSRLTRGDHLSTDWPG